LNPIRVIFDGHHIGRRQTGNETYAREMARALADRDDIDLILTVDNGRLEAARELTRASTRELPRNPIGRLAALPLLAYQRHADVIHTMYYLPPGPSRRTVVSVHDVSYERFPEFFSRAERWKNRLLIGDAIRRAGAICTLTNHAKSEIVDVYGVDPERVFVVPCGVAPAYLDAGISPRPERDERLRILAVGSLQPRKNIPRLVAAVRLVASQRPVKLSLIGPEGYQAQEIRALVGRDAIVEFLGYVSESRLIEAYQSADIFVYPSVYEGFGLPVVEAMACGTPVLTSTGGSLPEVAGSAALLVDPGDTVAIAAGIARLADDADLRSRLVRDGLSRARQFTWPAAALALSETYQFIVSR
jgi:glycosyltransferase involved in cell wall biosynthesis